MILVIDHYDSFTFSLVRYLAVLGRASEVREHDRMDPDTIDPARYEALLLSPGPRRPEDAENTGRLLQRLQGRLPILGVCLGHQVIARAYGASVIRAPRPMHGMLSDIRHTRSGLFAGLPDPLQVTRYHSLVVDPSTLPDCLEATAWTDDGQIMGLRHRTLPVYGVQFHPEAHLTQCGRDLLANFLAQTNQEVPDAVEI